MNVSSLKYYYIDFFDLIDLNYEILFIFQDGRYEFPDSEWSDISCEAKDLISNLLVKVLLIDKQFYQATHKQKNIMDEHKIFCLILS